MYVANTHDDLDNPPKVPMITGSVKHQPQKESLSDALANAASAIAKAFSSTQNIDIPPSTPSKTVSIRMQNLEQLRCLQKLREEGTLTEEEFLSQERIVLTSLNKLV